MFPSQFRLVVWWLGVGLTCISPTGGPLVGQQRSLEELDQQFPPIGALKRAAFSPDGQRLATGDYVGRVALWDLTTGEIAQRMPGLRVSEVTGIQFSRDGRRILCGWLGGDMAWLDAESGQVLRPHRDAEGYLTSFTLSRDEQRIVFAKRSAVLTIDAEFQGPVAALSVRTQGDLRLAMSPDGNHLVFGGFGKNLHVWDMTTSTQERFLLRQVLSVGDIEIDLQGTVIAVGGTNGIELFDLHTLEKMTAIQINDRVDALAFHPNGKQLATGSRDGIIRIWSVASGHLTSQLGDVAGPGHEIWGLCWSPNGKRIAAATRAHAAIWDTGTKKMLLMLGGKEPKPRR